MSGPNFDLPFYAINKVQPDSLFW
jgi:hypothetical protein